jgi:hypothetical protein
VSYTIYDLLCFYDRNKRVPVGLIDGLSQDWSVVDKDDIVQQYEVCIYFFFQFLMQSLFFSLLCLIMLKI